MDVHPIPQNVTSFQFKLVGDMTLKQFLYLTIGLGFAYLLFVLLSYNYPLIAWPLIIISALLGVSFAFLPIGSRPLDKWVLAFLKTIYSPTSRVWKKNNKTFKEDPLFSSRLVMYLTGTSQNYPTNNSENSERLRESKGQIDQIRSENQKTSESDTLINRQTNTLISSDTPSSSESFRPAEPLPTQEELGKTVDLARQAQQLQMKIIQTERTLSQIKTQTQKPTPIPVDYTHEVNKILNDLQTLVNQASLIKQQLQLIQAPPTKVEPAPQIPRPKVKVVIPPKPKQTQVALTSFPNVINGIIKDKENNYLEGVIAVIYDKEGLPVRALKTNKLGQFTGSTPLPNGTYTLELEKENYTFDVLQIELTGAILPPLSITAK